MKNTIAIIGVSFDLPNIKNWKDLKESLSNEKSFVTKMPDNRLKEIYRAFGEIEMVEAGYLDEINMFDNEYFGFTERESLKLFPEHRLFLTNAIKAFYHAGYSEAALKESKTGVFYTTSLYKSAYSNYSNVSDVSFNDFDFIKGIEATRLAKYLDLRGPVIGINTSCSSSLVAINTAIQSLNANECEMALVGGAKILSLLTKEASLNNVVHSKKGECRPFDQDADGMVNGEGAVFFVLKRYEQAIRDGDSILGEIISGATNHGGSRISSLTAPSSEAQKDVILQAWKKAEIDVSKIKFIEAHGTGTVLGDPIEIEAIKQAFYQSNSLVENSCAISSFKGQIGHLDYLSGLAGLLRLVAALHYEIIPNQTNFNKLNEYFNIENTGLYVPINSKHWKCDNGERIGGVSSFGMTGTNVHLVVSKKDIVNTKTYDKKEVNYLQISGSTSQKLKFYKDHLIQKIEGYDCIEDINKLCLRLNRVFRIDNENQGIIYSSKESLITSLRSNRSNSVDEKIFLLLDLYILEYSKEFIKSVFVENLLIKEQWDLYVSLEVESIQNQEALNILFQYVIYKYLFEKLKTKIKLITTKEESILNRLLKSKITIEQVIQQGDIKQTDNVFDEGRFKKYVSDNFSNEEVVIIDFSNKNKNRFDDLNAQVSVIEGFLSSDDRFLLYSNILELGVNPMIVSSNPVFNDIELPYFSPKCFWPKLDKMMQVSKSDVSNASDVNVSDLNVLDESEIKSLISKIWSSILEIDNFNEDDDFFNLGGTSLSAMDMIDDIEKNIKGVKILYEEIYSYSTISKLSNKIQSKLNDNNILLESKENEGLDTKRREEDYRNLIKKIKKGKYSKNIPENILITGGTGLLGMAIIDYLIEHTEAKLYSIVRKKEFNSSEERFWSVFEKYYEIRDQDRIHIIEGDLYLEDLGVNNFDISDNKIDMIFHTAGSPKFVSKKSKTNHINFLGTKNIVNWANKNEIKKFSFISAASVIGRTMPLEVENFYETDTNLGQQSNLIHGLTKLAAEEYIDKHYKYKSKKFRISNLGGKYKDGCFPTDLNKNLMWLKLKSLSELEFYCEEILDQYSGIGLMPVDVVSMLISEISFTNVESLDVYHIQRRINFTNREVLKCLKEKGAKIELTSYDNFMAYIKKNNYKMNFHKVAKKENTFKYNDEATYELISKLNLDEVTNLDGQTYLERLIRTNLKKHNQTTI